MFALIVIGAGIGVSMIRVALYKKGKKKTKKIQYYNYIKYEVKYKKINNAVNERTKGLF